MWQELAACRTGYPMDAVFFDRQHESPWVRPTFETQAQQHIAKADYCYRCPVVSRCLENQLNAFFGTAGGLDQAQRAVLRLKRKHETEVAEGKRVDAPHLKRPDALREAMVTMNIEGWTPERIAALLRRPQAEVDLVVSRWSQTVKGKLAASTWKGWAMLRQDHRMIEVKRETGLDYDQVRQMRTALRAVEERIRKDWRWAPLSIPASRTAGSITTAA